MGMQGFPGSGVPFVFTQNYGLIGDPSTLDNYGPQGVWTIGSSLSWAKGRHSFKFGGQFEREFTVSASNDNEGGTFNFSQAETGLPGFPQSGWDFASLMPAWQILYRWALPARPVTVMAVNGASIARIVGGLHPSSRSITGFAGK